MKNRVVKTSFAFLLMAFGFGAVPASSQSPKSHPVVSEEGLPENLLITGNKREHTVSFFDLDTAVEVVRKETGRAPHEIAISPDGLQAVVVSYREQGFLGNTLHVFDTLTGKQTSTIDIGENLAPHGIKWIGDSDHVIATTEASQTVVRVNVKTGQVVASIGTGAPGSHMVALSPDNATAYVANIQGGSVSVIDLESSSLKQVVPMGQGTEGISVSPDGKYLWVGNNGSRNVLKVDASSFEIMQTIPTKGIPIRVEISPNGKWVAVSEADLHMVSIFSADSGELVGQTDLTLSGGQVPVTILWAPDSESYFVAATASNTVHEIEASDWTAGKVFKAGDGSDGLALVIR